MWKRFRISWSEGGVTLDESRHDTTSSLDTEGERSYIKQEEILHFLGSVTRENSSLDGSTTGDRLVRVDALLAIEEVRHELHNTWARRTFSTGSRVLRKRSWHSSSKRARVREVQKSIPS